ncbi:MAG: right-handed parallel beta-helix repeat-containing protein [Phycisphaerales bacterium]
MRSIYVLAVLMTLAIGCGFAHAGSLRVGPDPDDDYATISEAIDNADGFSTTIFIEAGVYTENLVIHDKRINFYSIGGEVVIDGGQLDRTVFITGDSSIDFHSITIANGFTTGQGAGVYVGSNCSVYFYDCVVRQNEALTNGGGVSVVGRLSASNTIFEQNTAGVYGGGVHLESMSDPGQHFLDDSAFIDNDATDGGGLSIREQSSGPTMRDCTFNNNIATGRGGAIALLGSPTNAGRFYPVDCLFTENAAEERGGAIWVSQLDRCIARNCIFYMNQSTGLGGAVSVDTEFVAIACTFVTNSADDPVGETFHGRNSEATIQVSGSIVVNDSPQTFAGGGVFAVDHSILTGAGTTHPDDPGVFDADPRFVDPDGLDADPSNDFALRSDSPAIDAGNARAGEGLQAIYRLDEDFAGNHRIFNDPDTPDTGLSLWGRAIDMGAHEYHPPDVEVCEADLNGDGVLNFFDVSVFLSSFSAGCP